MEKGTIQGPGIVTVSAREHSSCQTLQIQLFENKKVRTVWDEEKQEWFFSIVDVCGVLAESKDYDTARKYWSKLKERLIAEGYELVTNCLQLKMVSPKDGKRYNTDVADISARLRIIQSIPSKKAEPFKRWMAKVATERINQMIDLERSYHQGIQEIQGPYQGEPSGQYDKYFFNTSCPT